jgi:hypothetical protein
MKAKGAKKMVNQNFDEFVKVAEKHKSTYLGGSKSKNVGSDVLENNKNHGTSVGAEGRNITKKSN